MNQLDRIVKALAGMPCDALLLSSPISRRYATGFPSSAGIVLIHRGGGLYYTDFRYIEAARQAVPNFEVALLPSGRSYNDVVNDLIARYGIKTLGYENMYVTAAQKVKFDAELKAELYPMDDMLDRLRAIKAPWEVENIVRAQRIAERALEETLPLIRPGVTEQEVAAELIYRMYRYGAECQSFDAIVVAGENSSKPHGVPGPRPIKDGDFVTMDFGCVVDGYCSDMTRTVAVGHASDEMKKIYDLVLQAQLAGLAATKADIPCTLPDKAARDIIYAAGYQGCFEHGFGHSLGLEIHEEPRLSHSSKDILREGTVVPAEPGIYLEGRMGVRIEDMMLVTKDGCENLTRAPKELLIL